MRRLAPFTVPFVLAGLLLAACGLPRGGGGGHYAVTAWFPRAVSLYPASDVRVLGLPAGKVSDVRVVGERVRVTLRVSSSVPVPASRWATDCGRACNVGATLSRCGTPRLPRQMPLDLRCRR